MKIGILTFHRAHNYGAVLQCYALKETLCMMGYDAHVIDYHQPQIEKIYSFHRAFGLRSFLRAGFMEKFTYIPYRLYLNLKRLAVFRRKKRIFEQFQMNYLSLIKTITKLLPADLDAYVIGSDMLWADECMLGKFDSYYLGEFKHLESAKVIGYAISGTTSSFEKLGRDGNFDFLKNFTSCSVREKSLADIVKRYTRKEIDKCIDPTLLTQKSLWSSILDDKWRKRKRYIILYYLRLNEIERQYIDNKAEEYARCNDLDIIHIDMSATAMPVTVEDFVSSICYAQHIITDSFHGIVFSMIFHKSFQAIKMNDSHDTRYTDILKKFQIPETIFSKDLDIKLMNLDYDRVDRNIADYRASSIEYLQKALC